MRITIPIVSASGQWSADFPHLKDSDGFSADGKDFDENIFRSAVRRLDRIQISSSDSFVECGFASMLLSALGNWIDDESIKSDDRKLEVTKDRMARKTIKGRVSYVRIDIASSIIQYGVSNVKVPKVKITYTDNGVVETRRFEYEFALVVADFVREFSKRQESQNLPPVIITPETKKLIDELHKISAKADLEEKRATCHFRTSSGYCTPCQFSCPLCKGGRCSDAA